MPPRLLEFSSSEEEKKKKKKKKKKDKVHRLDLCTDSVYDRILLPFLDVFTPFLIQKRKKGNLHPCPFFARSVDMYTQTIFYSAAKKATGTKSRLSLGA